ncbi:uncharacterized protein LOC132282594 [Cornus florida]|uniref:uncharacterized protein LOC132282594 n=1 Tax=Cornus florida TaxID=4283 RepID=UPI00289B1657|nr:uncharacterized protein LOC132282594 [Cornus florida]
MSSSELRIFENPRKWRFTWEAQSHIPTLRLFLFNPNSKPSTQCKNLNVNLVLQQSLLIVSWSEEEEELEISLRVPIPRALVDVESPVHFRALDDHIDVKLVLLLPVDHPIFTNLEDECNRENAFLDDLRPLLMDSEIKNLSSDGGVHFYCRNCSTKLTRCLSFFVEMPSVNWPEVADNWFGSCCCSFGGISEKLVTRYANCYTCAAGICLLNTTSVILCKDDLLGCKLPYRSGSENYEPEADFTNDKCLTKSIVDNGSDHGRVVFCENQSGNMHEFSGNLSCIRPKNDKVAANQERDVFEKVTNADSLSSILPALRFSEDVASAPGCCNDMTSPAINHDTQNCSFEMTKNNGLLANQKSFLNGFLGNVFMVRSSNLSKDVQWIKFPCPTCSRLLGAYPCGSDLAPLDGGVRLFKCCISTCLPVGGPSDLFRRYDLERMFTNQLLESAKDELSFRTLVRDLQTRSPKLQIVLLNPNLWCCTDYCLAIDDTVGTVAKIDLYPATKVLFSECSSSTDFEPRLTEEWVAKNQADEVYMLEHQIQELIGSLESAKGILPPSYSSLQGFTLSSMRR